MRGILGTGLAALALAGVWPAATAMADPWTLPAAELRLTTTYSYSDAVDALDHDGERDLDGDFYMHELAILIEYGATEYMTLIAQPHIRWVDEAGVTEEGHSHSDLGIRLRLGGGDTDIISVQATVTLPGDIDTFDNVVLNQGDIEYEVRGLYGARFDLHGIPAFLNLEGAYRWRDGGPADEWHADFAFGWQPRRDLDVIVESLNVWGEGQGDDPLIYPYFRQHQARGSFLMHLSPNFALQVGGYYTWDGQNVIAEDGGFVSGRYSF